MPIAQFPPFTKARKPPNTQTGADIKKSLLVAIILLHALSTIACGSDETPNNDGITLCNGSDDIRLAYRIHGGNLNTSPGSQIMFENGFSFLLIDGKCNYWAYPKGETENSGRWNDVATGKLTAEQETSLKQNLSINEWQRWNKQTSFQDLGADMSSATFWTPSAVFHCYGKCGTASEREIQTNTRKTMQTLANNGESLTGPIRVTAVIVTDDMISITSPPPFQPAPPEIDFQKHAISQETASQHCTDKTFEVSGPAADKLRQYREEFRTNQHGYFPTRQYLPLQTEDGTQYLVYARDSIPHLENIHGLIQLEGLPSNSPCP